MTQTSSFRSMGFRMVLLLGLVLCLWIVGSSACTTIDVPLFDSGVVVDARPDRRPPPEIKKEVDRCPGSCQTNADCQNCPSGAQFCVNGGCWFEPSCATLCRNDQDCLGCEGGRIYCDGGSCQTKPKPPVCALSCRKDQDCASCKGPVTHTCVPLRVGGICMPDGGPSCPATCRGSDDCKDCKAGRTTCVSGAKGSICAPFFDRCSGPCQTNNDCKGCLLGARECLRGRCSARIPCSQTSDCERGEVCFQSICVRQRPCRISAECPRGWRCEMSFCTPG
jgi:hypothetical protein